MLFGNPLDSLEPLGNLKKKATKTSWPPTNAVALITGGNTGLGKANAIALAQAGFTVIVTSRSLKRAQDAAKEITQEVPNSTAYGMKLDLCSFRNVKDFIREFTSRFPVLHILVNNAGGTYNEKVMTEDGLESTIQGNHISVQMLTVGLLPCLEKAEPSARVINLSSVAHLLPQTLHADPAFSFKYFNSLAAYGLSKLYNVAFTMELRSRLKQKKSTILTVSVHPGAVGSDFYRNLPGFVRIILNCFFKTPKVGARTQIYLCLAPASKITELYYMDCLPTSFSSFVTPQFSKELWKNTQKIVDKYYE